ncbi:MAG: hypothetical protein CLLPBCKN_000489 [Chroococcidiopsis cubana SAG 39.79]|nr:hypothetical protein [Chroococcidiopsis cubana SAG 39.79]
MVMGKSKVKSEKSKTIDDKLLTTNYQLPITIHARQRTSS